MLKQNDQLTIQKSVLDNVADVTSKVSMWFWAYNTLNSYSDTKAIVRFTNCWSTFSNCYSVLQSFADLEILWRLLQFYKYCHY